MPNVCCVAMHSGCEGTLSAQYVDRCGQDAAKAAEDKPLLTASAYSHGIIWCLECISAGRKFKCKVASDKFQMMNVICRRVVPQYHVNV